MNKVISIVFLFIMLLQVLPITQWLNDEPSIQWVPIDEEKDKDQYDKGKGGKEEVKALPILTRSVSALQEKVLCFITLHHAIPPSPHLELLVPPPNACA